MVKPPLLNIFGALRDGYGAEAEEFFRTWRAELEAAERRGPWEVFAVADRLDTAIPAWVADVGGRLRRDLLRATEAVLAEHRPGEQDAIGTNALDERPARVTAWMEAHRPEDPELLRMEPTNPPRSRAVVAGLRFGSGSGILLWLTAFLFVPAPFKDGAYVLSVLAGMSLGISRFQQTRTQEARAYRLALDQRLARAAGQARAAVEQYVIQWVRAMREAPEGEPGSGLTSVPSRAGEGE